MCCTGEREQLKCKNGLKTTAFAVTNANQSKNLVKFCAAIFLFRFPLISNTEDDIWMSVLLTTKGFKCWFEFIMSFHYLYVQSLWNKTQHVIVHATTSICLFAFLVFISQHLLRIHSRHTVCPLWWLPVWSPWQRPQLLVLVPSGDNSFLS